MFFLTAWTKLAVQTQEAYLKIRGDDIRRYTDTINCGQYILKEQVTKRFWNVNWMNCICYFPAPAFNPASFLG